MTTEQCIKRNEKIMKAWEEWKHGENYLDNLDCAILCDMLDIKYPSACQRYLQYTDNPNSASVASGSGAVWKTIFNFLAKLANANKNV